MSGDHRARGANHTEVAANRALDSGVAANVVEGPCVVLPPGVYGMGMSDRADGLSPTRVPGANAPAR